MSVLKISVPLKPIEYSVVIESGLLDTCGEYFKDYPSVVLLCDEFVDSKFADRFEKALLGFSSVKKIVLEIGEQAKSLKVYREVLEKMSKAGILRNSAVICLGGGVVGDLGAFIASTYMRGIDYFHFPTTLLAMADSSIGGKNGINLRSGKNLVGTINPPKAVLIDTDLIQSLPETHIDNGLGEILKHAFYADLSIIKDLQKNRRSEKALQKAIQIKGEILADGVENANKRQWLNVGHSIAHALEELSGFKEAHGQAVIIGILWESYLALKLRILEQKDFDKILEIFQKLDLRYLPQRQYDLNKVWELMLKDKKNMSNETVTMALLNELGSNVQVQEIMKEDFVKISEEYYIDFPN